MGKDRKNIIVEVTAVTRVVNLVINAFPRYPCRLRALSLVKFDVDTAAATMVTWHTPDTLSIEAGATGRPRRKSGGNCSVE